MKNILLIQPKSFLKLIYPKAVWKINTIEKIIYLTFDDGPIPGLTEWVLDELKKFDAKATFFCVGSNILKNPDIFERIKQEGHMVANHTMYHPRGFKTESLNYINEAEDCRKIVKNDLFRPPYGQLKRSQYKALLDKGFKIIFWDVISYDYEKISEKACANNVILNTKPGSIVLFHDNYKAEKNLRYSLPLYLKHFAHLHYKFNVIES
ncbi:MAG: polysaccharide deacetylase family protein [Bacteroidota bacterium]|nr:polysaccharide deacetylase family protein [Bacteroidota bacterium]